MAVQTYTKTGSKAATQIKLDKSVFGVEVKNHQLLKDAYLSYLSNRRTNLAQTKKRGEVSGGGAKPHRQKGTGRARAGSIRSPLWRGGGITFGPSGNENYSRTLNTKAKRQALRQALSLAATDDKLLVIEDLAISDGKTKSATKLLSKIVPRAKVLVISESLDSLTQRALRNLQGVNVVNSKYLSVFHVLNADKILITKPGLDDIRGRLGKEKSNE